MRYNLHVLFTFLLIIYKRYKGRKICNDSMDECDNDCVCVCVDIVIHYLDLHFCFLVAPIFSNVYIHLNIVEM